MTIYTPPLNLCEVHGEYRGNGCPKCFAIPVVRRGHNEPPAPDFRDLADLARRLAEALENAGEKAAAEAVISAPVVVAPPMARALPKVATRFSERWSFEVVNLLDYVKAVAAGKAPLAGLRADETFFQRQATALKAEASFPGVRFFSTTTAAGKASR